jgi:predicted transcriptional regulator
MLKKELDSSISITKREVDELNSSYKKKTEILGLLRTPIAICNEYIENESSITMYSSKKRKEIERKLNGFKENYKWLLDDITKIKEQNNLKKKMDFEINELSYLENYSKIHIDKICKILLKDEFISKEKEKEKEEYQLTEFGLIASNINEIHPLIASKIIMKWNWFENFNENQIISLFSIFTDIHVPEDFKRLSSNENNHTCKYIKELADDYEKRELEYELYTGIQYDKIIVYDLLEEMKGWIQCETVAECKYFIQNVIIPRGISIGDFSKAILKISVITKEFIGVCEMVGEVGLSLLHKLKKVDTMILKYIATPQSLYV